MTVRATLLIAAHGTRSPSGSVTTAALATAVAAVRPEVDVSLCFLDVADPTLAAALDGLSDRPVVVVPLLLSAGYHVHTDIPAIVAGRAQVRVARHLGPDPTLVSAVMQRLDEAGGSGGSVLLAAIGSSRSSARAEVDVAADMLATALGRAVTVVPLGGEPQLPDPPFDVAVYLLAEGGFLTALRENVAGRGAVAAPIGVHPALVSLVWTRYDEVNLPAR